ncbi:MAG: hypothetical protein EU542_09325, partial [Promethearchaeota archaeon]
MAEESIKTLPIKEEQQPQSPLDGRPFWLQAPYRLLTDITQFRQLDPWDLEIDTLITRFVQKMKDYEDINFPILGRAILSAAILYRTKVSDLIKLIEEKDKEEAELEALEFEIPQIDPSYHISQRPVTFNELLYAFEGLLKQEEVYRKRVQLQRRKSSVKAAELPLEPIKIVDEESTKIARTKKETYQKLVELFIEKQRAIKFVELIPPQTTRINVVRIFLCILFLSFEGKASIFQKEDLGEIQLIPIRDKEEEFLKGFDEIVKQKLKKMGENS